MDPEPLGSRTDPDAHAPGPTRGLRLRPLPPCDGPTFPVLHEYFEVVYGPMIGPTPTLLARALARHLDEAGGPVTVCPIEIAREVGLRASHDEPLGKSSHLAKAIERLAHHRLVERVDSLALGIMTTVPPLSARAVSKLPESVRRAHEQFVS